MQLQSSYYVICIWYWIYWSLVITFNYTSIVNFHILQNYTKSSAARSVFTRYFLVTASNNGKSSASVLKSSFEWRLFSNWTILVNVKV
jgi:hypothetical protein